MPEQELNSPAAKFISSLVRSLQILCNGQVDFNESIELVGHINVRVDRKFKFDYIVDEQVSREGGDSSTTFLSNSYHSCPPLKQSNKKVSPPEFEQDVMFSDVPQNVHKRGRQSKNSVEISGKHQLEESSAGGDESIQNYSVAIESMARESGQSNQMVVKIEGGDDSNDCMVLPASPGDYEPVGEVSGAENFPVAGTSGSFDESISIQMNRTRKRRKANDQSTDERESQISGPSTLESHSAYPQLPSQGRAAKLKAGIVYECVFCTSMFRTEEDFRIHTQVCQQPVLSYCCSMCFYRADQQERIDNHLHDAHQIPLHQFVCKIEKPEDSLGDQFPNRDDSSPQIKIGKIMHGSPVTFNYDSQIKSSNRDMSHSAVTFHCSMCHFKSASQEQLEHHVNQHHQSQADVIPCTQCGAVFKTQTGLKMHMEVKHTTNPTLKCPICGKSMYNKMNLDGHINQHNGVKPHVCTYCGKNFSYKQSLSAHGKMCAMKHI